MYKLIVFGMIIVAANAGIIDAGLGHGALVAPVAVAHHAPLATSYQNSNQISLHPTAVVATHAVGVAHAAPIAVGVAHAAPVAVVGHGIGLGLH